MLNRAAQRGTYAECIYVTLITIYLKLGPMPVQDNDISAFHVASI